MSEVKQNRGKGVFYVEENSFRNISHKTALKSQKTIVRDYSGQCPDKYFVDIGPVMEQYNWSIGTKSVAKYVWF